MKINKHTKYLVGLTLFVSIAHAAPRSPGKDDFASTTVNQETTIHVLDNDSGRNLRLTEVDISSANGGIVRKSADNLFVYYTPKADYTGNDEFWYTFQDARRRSNSAKVTVTINSNSDSTIDTDTNTVTTDTTNPVDSYTGWPVATTDVVSTSINTPISIPVLENDLGQSLSITESNAYTQHGGTTSVIGRSINFQPAANFTGVDTFWYAIVDPDGRSNSTQVTINITEIDSGSSDGIDTAPAGSAVFDLVTMQNDILHGTNFQYDSNYQPETGGFVYFNIDSAPAGATELLFIQGSSPSSLIPNQLVTYIGVDGEYYTSSVATVQNNTITLKQPLKVAIARGTNLQNFYSDASHPHVGGLSAVADLALRKLNDPSLNAGKHVLLGDSWFASGFVEERLGERLPNAKIINKGVGGNTSFDLLSRFELDVIPESPDVVWLIAGTNDYFMETSKVVFIANMKSLIEKITAMGARPIVFDSSLAPLMYGSDSLLQLSKSYATGLAEINVNTF
jgi:hypothetical protein